MPVLFLTADLMFSSKVVDSAKRQGIELQTVMGSPALLEKAAGADLVIVDLTTPGLDVAVLLPHLRSLAPPPRTVIAYGPHVQEARLAAAQDAGCDLVLARGQFHAQMDDLLARYGVRAG